MSRMPASPLPRRTPRLLPWAGAATAHRSRRWAEKVQIALLPAARDKGLQVCAPDTA